MNALHSLSDALAEVVSSAAPSLVRVDDGSRLTATGLVFAPDVIVTTSHGTERDDDLTVITHDGTRLPATLLGRDTDTDLAALKVATALPPLARAETEPRVGQLVVALGRPGDYGLTATLGLLSSVQPTQTSGTPEYIVTTDATLYPGVSGGALLDASGQLLGLLNRMYGRGGNGVALGVPLLTRVTEALLAHGRVPRGYLGVRMQRVALPDSLRVTHSIAQQTALLLVGVEPGSAAEAAGLLLGDTLLALDGHTLDDTDGLRSLLIPGRPFTVTLLRGGEKTTLSGTAGAAPA